MLSRLMVSVSVALFLSLSASAQQPRRGEITFEPYMLVTYDGQSHAAELGRLQVPENRSKSSGRLIQIAFVRLKSSSPQPASPIVFLAGGPGVPGVGMARVPVYYDLFEKLGQVADVILLDQRGLGMSSPNLNDCPTDGKFTVDAFATEENFVRALALGTETCSLYWRSKGVDLTAYNTEESADDLEDLRQALGASKLSLVGHSYGTELALSMIRRHDASVERAVLAGTEGPGDHGTSPFVLDLQLKKLARLVAADPALGKEIPDLVALFQADVAKLQKQPASLTVTMQKTKQPVTLKVGPFALQFITARLLSNGRAVSSLPALLQSVSAGDYSLLQPRVEALYNDFESGVTLMGRTMSCSAPTPSERLSQTLVEERASLFGGIGSVDMQPQACKEAVGSFTLGAEYFAPLFSSVPTLFLSGTLDSNTPPMKAERLRWGFPLSTHIIVENGFHETLPVSEVQALVADFFKGQDVAGRRIVFDPPRFLSLEDAKKPSPRR